MKLGDFIKKCDYMGIDYTVCGFLFHVPIDAELLYQYFDYSIVDISIFFEDRSVIIYV